MDMFDVLFAKAVSGGGGAAPTLITKNITANGSYAASDDDADGYSAVSVDVANTYTAQDESKVVSNGALVAQTAHATITDNGTYDTTLNNSVTVDVPQGATNIVPLFQLGTTKESGFYAVMNSTYTQFMGCRNIVNSGTTITYSFSNDITLKGQQKGINENYYGFLFFQQTKYWPQEYIYVTAISIDNTNHTVTFTLSSNPTTNGGLWLCAGCY